MLASFPGLVGLIPMLFFSTRQVIKNWRQERPGNEENYATLLYTQTHVCTRTHTHTHTHTHTVMQHTRYMSWPGRVSILVLETWSNSPSACCKPTAGALTGVRGAVQHLLHSSVKTFLRDVNHTHACTPTHPLTGSLSTLLEYETARQRHNVPMAATIEGLYHLFSTSWTPAVLLRSLGFQITNAVPPIKVGQPNGLPPKCLQALSSLSTVHMWGRA